jgi:hypothetical protein
LPPLLARPGLPGRAATATADRVCRARANQAGFVRRSSADLCCAANASRARPPGQAPAKRKREQAPALHMEVAVRSGAGSSAGVGNEGQISRRGHSFFVLPRKLRRRHEMGGKLLQHNGQGHCCLKLAFWTVLTPEDGLNGVIARFGRKLCKIRIAPWRRPSRNAVPGAKGALLRQIPRRVPRFRGEPFRLGVPFGTEGGDLLVYRGCVTAQGEWRAVSPISHTSGSELLGARDDHLR